ncbi:unnamed protein product [Discosporangium mesarthrocarpum]
MLDLSCSFLDKTKWHVFFFSIWQLYCAPCCALFYGLYLVLWSSRIGHSTPSMRRGSKAENCSFPTEATSTFGGRCKGWWVAAVQLENEHRRICLRPDHVPSPMDTALLMGGPFPFLCLLCGTCLCPLPTPAHPPTHSSVQARTEQEPPG